MTNLLAVNAQCPTVDFNIKSSYCRNEKIVPENLSSGDNYYWEICEDNLLYIDESLIWNDGNIAFRSTYSIFNNEVNNNWYGFTIRNNGTAYRFTYNLTSNTTEEFYNLNASNTSLPRDFQTLFHEDNWYGLIANSGNTNPTLVSFGSDLLNTNPSYTTLSLSSNILNTNGLAFFKDGSDVYALLGGANSNSLNMIDFSSDLAAVPSVNSFTITDADDITGISMIQSCDYWYGLATSQSNNKLFRLIFDNGITNTPTIEEIIISESDFVNPAKLKIVVENGFYYAFIQMHGGKIFRLEFENDLSNTPLVSILNAPNINCHGIDIIQSSQGWYLTSVDRGTSETGLYGYSFDNQCLISDHSSSDFEPTNLIVNTAGDYSLRLIASNNDEKFLAYQKNFTITSDTAPPISFTPSENECLGQTNTFTPSNTELVSYEWSFDNGETIGSTATNPSHTFSQAGDSTVSLTVSDGTCTNFVRDTISIYPEPVAPTFSTPGAPYCTGADLEFENLFDESNYSGATLTYAWNYNGEGNSSDRDGSFAFDTDGTKTITLTASIPGCSTPSTGTDINLISGPDVDFSFENLCLGQLTQFTNSTTGTGIIGQTWDFGDESGISSASSPTYTYGAYGNYEVSLTVNNNQGCSNEMIKSITIEDKPVAAFAHGPACEGANISFIDESTVEGLANITSYEWDFEGLGFSNEQNPSFTFNTQGSYDVELMIETTAGCRDTLVSAVNVLLAPTANFEIDLGCINTETVFLDQSEGDFSNPITQWIWTIDGSLASYSSSFGQVYNDIGDHTISLQVRSANNCQSIQNDLFSISDLPQADFITGNECDNENTLFQDVSVSTSTEIVSHYWQFDNENSSTTNPTSHQFPSAGNFTVALTVRDEIGCEGTVQKTVTIQPSPSAELMASKTIGPSPLTIDFSNETQDVSSSLWMFGDEQNSTSTASQPQFTYTELGDYNVQLITTNDWGCSDTAAQIVSVANPILDLELEQISTEESEGKTNISLTVRNSGNVILQGFDIRIDLDNNSSIYESYPNTLARGERIIYPLNFTFSSIESNIGYACITVLDREEEFEDVNIVNNERCIDFDQQLIVENSYPNPVKSSDRNIRLNMILPFDGPVQLFLLDATGAVLFQNTYMDTSAGLNSFFIDIYSFDQGMYFIKAVFDQTSSTQRFVKI